MQHEDNKKCKMKIAFHASIVLGPRTWRVYVRGGGGGDKRFRKKKQKTCSDLSIVSGDKEQ